jgi:CubicO group peptidase (beta-lactamase class C family)
LSHALPQTLALLQEGIEAGWHLGAQVYVATGDDPVADFAVGMADGVKPLESTDLMAWMSACKPVAALGLARLAEAGLLDINAPVAAYLPSFASGGKEAVTVRHVLTHTGGFRSVVDLGWRDEPWEQIIDRVCAAPLEKDWVPGHRAAYHIASGWYVLAEIIRNLSGMDYAEFVRREVFLPLGMEDSWVGMPANVYPAYADRLVPLFDTTGGKTEPVAFWQGEKGASRCVPGAGGRGPMRDLARMYRMLLEGGRSADGFFLQPGTVEAFTRIQRRGLMDETFRHKLDWGLGFIVDSKHYGIESVPYGYGRYAAEGTFGHGGRQSVSAFADPSRGLVVALAVNGMPGEARHHRRFLALNSALYQDLGLAA